MAGYNHQAGMSNNAVCAYASGVKPLSKFKASDFTRFGNYPITFFKWLVKKEIWERREWHHTSKHFNETDFYDTECLDDYLEEEELNNFDSLFNQYKDEKASLPKKSNKNYKKPKINVICDYLVWGKRSRPPIECQQKGVLTGKWIFLEDGSKKSIYGKNTSFKFDSKVKLSNLLVLFESGDLDIKREGDFELIFYKEPIVISKKCFDEHSIQRYIGIVLGRDYFSVEGIFYSLFRFSRSNMIDKKTVMGKIKAELMSKKDSLGLTRMEILKYIFDFTKSGSYK